MGDATMRVFLSHVYEERKLAGALKTLIERISEGGIKVWYSSDPRPAGGMELGDWRKTLQERMEKSDEFLAIVTPDSNGRAWVAWESGFAQGSNKQRTPVVFFMKVEKMHSVYGNLMAFRGDKEKGIARLCAMLLKKRDGRAPRDAEIKGWRADIADYLALIREREHKAFARSLFHDHFHNAQRASQLEDKTWYAKWMCELEDGTQEVFEIDSLSAWSTSTRLRMVGEGAKGAYYAMEGVVSANGHICLSYWSSGAIPICGTTLLEPGGLEGDILEGTWSGFTAKTLKDKNLRYFRGKVVMALDRKVAEDWDFD